MPKLKEIMKALEQLAPTYLAESWDNVGLMVGSPSQEVQKVLCALDLNEAVVDEAIEQKVQCIVTHHPFLFKAIKHINLDQKTKYLIPTRDQFSYNPVPLKGIIELVSDEMIDHIEVEELKGSEKLMTIYNNIYRIEMKRCAGINPTFFKQCVQLTSEIPVYRMKRATGKWTVDHQIKWIEQQFLDGEKLYKTQ